MADDKRIYFAALDMCCAPSTATMGIYAGRSRCRRGRRVVLFAPATGSSSCRPSRRTLASTTRDRGKAAFTIKAAAEVGGVPYLREIHRPTAPRMIAISREGTLQGFASRFEPPAGPSARTPGRREGRLVRTKVKKTKNKERNEELGTRALPLAHGITRSITCASSRAKLLWA